MTFIQKINIPDFYKDVLDLYRKILSSPINNTKRVLSQSIWHNDRIKVGGKAIFMSRLYESGIKVVEDFLNPRRQFMTIHQFRNKFPLMRINFLQLQSIRRAIPVEWTNMIFNNNAVFLSNEEKRCCLIGVGNSKFICLKFLQVKHVYQILIDKTERTPNSQRKWSDEGFRIQSWRRVYESSFRCTTSTKLQSLQYRILHRYIPTRKFLYSRNIIGSSLCLSCFEVDNLQHIFCTCGEVRRIWDFLLPQLKRIFSLSDNFRSTQTILFGSAEGPPIINLIILLCKQYIVSCKLGAGTRVTIDGILHIIENQFNTEKLIASSGDSWEKFWLKWEKIIDRNSNNALK